MIIPTLLGNVKQPADGIDFYQCPVYMDYTMEVNYIPLIACNHATIAPGNLASSGMSL